MTGNRAFLEAALRRVIDGGDVQQGELDAAIPDARQLSGAELKAYLGLSYWADDDDIRARKPNYASVRRRGLAELLASLETE